MTNSSELLTVVKVSEDRQDKNGRNYKLVTFQSPNKQEIVDETTGEITIVRVPARRSVLTRWEESYLDDQMHYMFDAEVGEKVPGKIVTRTVGEYLIDDMPVNRYTAVVLGMTSDPGLQAEIERTFRSSGHEIVEETTLQDLPRVEAVKAPASTPEVETVDEDSAF